MKKLLIIILAVVFGLGCSKELDIKPTQSIDRTDVIASDENVKAALVGAYDALSKASFLGGDLQLYAELLAADGEITWAGTYTQPKEIYSRSILTNNSYVRDTWLQGYKIINICNNILAAIDVVNEKDRDQVKGEALFLRGLSYFEMVKLFAKPYSAGSASQNLGLQLVTTATTDSVTQANRVPRSTIEQTYAQILSDLKEAKSLLPLPEADDVTVYANAYTASAVLSRVYLQMGDFENARDEADAVISGDAYSLTPTYQQEFNNTANSSEDIFAMQVSAQHDENDLHLFWSITDYGARAGDVDIEQKHLDLYAANDARLKLFYMDDDDIYRSGKWKLQYRNIPLIRLAEMYLTRAESNFRLSTNVGASPAEDINDVIRKRVGLPATTITLDNILLERRLELAHEGQRIHDVKRLKQTVDGFAYDANKLVFPIPIREINAAGNGILKQNDGY